MIVRPATPTDVDVICDFNSRLAMETENKSLDQAILKAGVTAVLSDPHKGRYFVAEESGKVIAQLGITREWSDWRNGNFWWIQSVYVMASARRQGVFRKLYEHVISAARADADVIGVRLYVEHENAIAQATYRKMGMAMTGYQIMEEAFSARKDNLPSPPGRGAGGEGAAPEV
jgi:ribosomal protein S18 acetylase RimI-like enzyme